MPDEPVQDEQVSANAEQDTAVNQDVDTVEEAPETPDQPETTDVETDDAPDAEEAGTSEGSEDEVDAFTDVDLESLSEEERGRYEQMQADYTRKTQALAEQRTELESVQSFVTDLVADEPSEEQAAMQEQVFRALAERLGYELEGDDEATGDDAEEGDDEPEFRDPRVDALLAEREAEAEAKRAEQYEARLDEVETEIEDGLKGLAKKDGVDLTDDELGLLFDATLALPPVDGDKPDIAGAYKRLTTVLNVNKKRWIDSKKADPAPGGDAGAEKPDLSTPEGRQANLARIVQAAQGRQDQ